MQRRLRILFMPVLLTVFLSAAVSGVQADDAIGMLQEKARQGDAQAQFDLAKRYEAGDGVVKSDKIAAEWLELAANQGLADAQYYLGWMYANGYGVPRDKVAALVWFSRAAAQAHGDAADLKSAMMRDMSASDLAAVRRQLADKSASGQNGQMSQDAVLANYRFSEVRRGYNRDGATRKWLDALLLLARRGDPGAQNLLGYHLVRTATGKMAAARKQEAMRWFLAAARQAYAAGAYNLGVTFMEGRGVEVDMFSAIRWFEIAKASLPGDRPQDYSQATNLFREAAEYGHIDVYDAARQGYRSASTQLGELIELGLTEAKARRSMKN